MSASGRRLADLAAKACGTVLGDPEGTIARVAAVDDADADSLTFAVDERWLVKALASKARAVLVPHGVANGERREKTFIVVADVRAGLATILESFAPPLPRGEFTHPTAVIEEEVTRHENVWIGAGVVVRAGAVLGEDAVLLPGSYVGSHARIGAGTLLHPHAMVLDDCQIGERCVLQSNCVVGSDGFGFVRVGSEQIKIPQIGNVVVGDRVEIGACTTIDRAVTGSTRIGSGTKIDNLVQIAHNVIVGEDCTLCGQVGIAGSTRLGKGVIAAGQAGVVGHIEIGDGAVIAAGAKVIRSLPANSHVSGHYAQPHRADIQQKVLLRKLPKLFEQVRTLMKALDELRKPQ
jgi:UDP-3-O-[3-hydroxymyristoyl] glucosamine N-acyltransferase